MEAQAMYRVQSVQRPIKLETNLNGETTENNFNREPMQIAEEITLMVSTKRNRRLHKN